MVYQRGKTYWYEFKLNGIRVRESAQTNNKELAKKIETKRKNDMLAGMKGIEVKPVFKLFRIALEEYIESKRIDWEPSTLRMHETSKPKLLAFFGGMVLHEINAGDIRKYQLQRKTSPSEHTGKIVSNRTVNTEIVLVRQLLMHHRLWVRLTEGNDVHMLKENKEIGRRLTQDECVKLLQACKDSASRAIYPAVLLSIYTGLRNKELRTLKWEQIDFEQSTLIVGRTKTDAGSGRLIHFGEDAYTLLHNWKLNFPGVKSRHYVFPSQRYGLIGKKEIRGGVVAPYRTEMDRATASLNTSWRTAQKVAGVNCRWHDLRHTCASILGEGGATNATLMSMLGWMSPKMIERYTHASTRAKQAAVSNAAVEVRKILTKLDSPTTTVVQ